MVFIIVLVINLAVVKIILVAEDTVTFDHFSTSTIENIKYDPLELIKFAIEFFNEIKLCYDFDNSITFFWKKDY